MKEKLASTFCAVGKGKEILSSTLCAVGKGDERQTWPGIRMMACAWPKRAEMDREAALVTQTRAVYLVTFKQMRNENMALFTHKDWVLFDCRGSKLDIMGAHVVKQTLI